MWDPKISDNSFSAFGPCTASGYTSGSLILTSSFLPKATPLAYNNTSLSAIDSNIKKKLKKNYLKESLFNSKLYTKNLENAFIKIYENKKNNLKLKDIYIK